jgi:hypothetical protein
VAHTSSESPARSGMTSRVSGLKRASLGGWSCWRFSSSSSSRAGSASKRTGSASSSSVALSARRRRALAGFCTSLSKRVRCSTSTLPPSSARVRSSVCSVSCRRCGAWAHSSAMRRAWAAGSVSSTRWPAMRTSGGALWSVAAAREGKTEGRLRSAAPPSMPTPTAVRACVHHREGEFTREKSQLPAVQVNFWRCRRAGGARAATIMSAVALACCSRNSSLAHALGARADALRELAQSQERGAAAEHQEEQRRPWHLADQPQVARRLHHALRDVQEAAHVVVEDVVEALAPHALPRR